ncbi:hypothetical protein ACLGI4_13755 [Streptomyces sp. HMX112]|uniref:hypothetical protein n=1 Tax=Streptomyces sp. HMX112 TaxID=3390850 RepID=UPI003A80B6F1
MSLPLTARRRAAAFAGSALLLSTLSLTLSGCGSQGPSEGRRPSAPAAVPVSFASAAGSPVAGALAAQATAQERAARQTAERGAAERGAATEAPERRACTTDPADRSACRNPGGTVDPGGGDIDGDGTFEPDEPVGPGYRDPRAYDGGRTSGESQCAWLRSQGIAC